MAQDSTTNFFRNSFGSSNFNSINFINTRFYFSQYHHHHQQLISSSRHSILTFTVGVLVSFLELKYQAKNESPFETHPKTMYLAVTSLLLYCIAYKAGNSRISSNRVCCCIFKCIMALFGPLLVASVSSLLMPELLCPVLFFISVLFSLCELPRSKFVRFWKWLQEVIRLEIRGDQQQQHRRRRRVVAPVYPLRLLENVILEEDDVLPL